MTAVKIKKNKEGGWYFELDGEDISDQVVSVELRLVGPGQPEVKFLVIPEDFDFEGDAIVRWNVAETRKLDTDVAVQEEEGSDT